MAKGFIACDREQSFLMPPDVREWLPEAHFSWFVLDAVDAMDLDAFYGAYRVDGRSRPAYGVRCDRDRRGGEVPGSPGGVPSSARRARTRARS
jgi:hypothetical protein